MPADTSLTISDTCLLIFPRSPKPHIFPAHKSLVTSDPINVVIGWQDGEKKDELAAVARATRSSMEKLKLNFANFGWCHSLSMYSIRKQFTPFWGQCKALAENKSFGNKSNDAMLVTFCCLCFPPVYPDSPSKSDRLRIDLTVQSNQ